MAEPLSLHIAAKKVIDKFGADTIKTIRFANLVSDYRGYDEYPATQKILKDVLNKHYGDSILNHWRALSKEKVRTGCQGVIGLYKQKSGFREDLITYVFDCIFYALGCIDHVNAPFSNGYEAKSAASDDILGKLQEKLDNYKKQYVDELDKQIVLPVDILFDAPAYFTAHSLNILYGIEAKIYVLQAQLGHHNTSWCLNQRTTYLEDKKKEKLDAVTKELKKDKDNYLALLSSLATKPGGGIIQKSYYFEPDAEEQLSKATDRIKRLYKNVPKKYDDWCEHEKAQFLKKHSVTSADYQKQVLKKIGIPAAILAVISFGSINYISSIDDIEKYEQTMSAGDEKIKQGDYTAAFSLYQQAKNEYDGGWMKSSYENDAQAKIDENIELLISNCEGAIYAKEYGKAHDILEQIPENLIEKGSKESDALSVIKENISKAVDTEMENLIQNISANNGKMDAEGEKLLDNLLKLSPDDYWLNFIKNKQQ